MGALDRRKPSKIAPDWRVILFTAAVSATACLIFGLAPFQYAINAQPINTLKAAGRGLTTSRRRFLTQRTFLVAQIAISLVLLVGASLFITSFRQLLTFDPGMRERDITVAFLAFEDAHVAPDRDLVGLQWRLLENVKSLPGVINAGSATTIPLIGGSWEHAVDVGSIEGMSKFTWVSPGYFNTMGIPVIAGRDFTPADTRSSQRVAIVNKTFVRHYFPNSNPLGQSVRTVVEPNYPSTLYQIVGVTPDTKYNSLWTSTPAMAFAPASQHPHPSSL